MDYIATTLREKVIARLQKENPAASVANLNELADKIVAHGGCGLVSFTLDDDLLDQHVSFLSGQNAKLLLPVPSDAAVYRALEKKKTAELKAAWPDHPARQQIDPKWKIETGRSLRTMTDEARFEAVPGGEPVATNAPTKVTPPADSVEALDAEMLRRWNKGIHDVGALDRQRFHGILKAEQGRAASKKYNDDAALLHAGNDTSALSPADRMTRFRAAEKAKNRG